MAAKRKAAGEEPAARVQRPRLGLSIALDGTTSGGPAQLLKLRPYQQEAVVAVHAAAERGVTRPLIALPTGTGKTIAFARVIADRGGRALVLAHRDELIQQAAEKLRLVMPGAPIGIVKADQDEVDAPVVVASVQTLARPRRLERLPLDFRTIVVDEAHHAAAESYRRVLDHLGSFRDGGPLTLGVTATPERADGAALGAVFEEVVYRRTIEEMIDAGYLCDLRAVQVQLAVDLRGLHTRHGDFVEGELERVLMAADAPEHAAVAYQEHAPGRKALVFTPTVAVAHAMAAAFRRAGVPAEALDGAMPLEERRAVLARLRTGDTRVVCNCAVLTEGFDEPSVDCIVIARPTRSRPLYIQMLGRGTRVDLGKNDCIVLDLVGATTRHDLVTAASLFGLEPRELAERPLTEVLAARREAEEQAAVRGRLIARAVDLFRRRDLHWVAAREGRFVLPLGDGLLIVLPEDDGRWAVRVRTKAGTGTLASGLDLGYAQGVAEDYARRAGAGALANPRARWRQEPATEKQIHHLRRLGLPVRPDLTKGEAADLLAAAFAGGVR